MRYFNEAGEEIQFEDVDLEKGHLEPYRIFVAHHEAVETVEEKYHYEVKNVYFEEGHCIADVAANDPRVVVINDQTGEFDFNDERGYHVRHIDVRKVIDVAYVAGRGAYDEYDEDCQQYFVYSEEELAQIAANREAEAKKAEFLENGYTRVDNIEISLDDLTLAVADMIGA